MENTQTLSDATLEKVSVIEDINKLKVLMDGKAIEPDEFDILMDKEIGELVNIMDHMTHLIEFKKNVLRIGEMLRDINKHIDDKRDNPTS
jgi:hypothetical protein